VIWTMVAKPNVDQSRGAPKRPIATKINTTTKRTRIFAGEAVRDNGIPPPQAVLSVVKSDSPATPRHVACIAEILRGAERTYDSQFVTVSPLTHSSTPSPPSR
jgi:hypothetical protein